jgi:hypothetical protein
MTNATIRARLLGSTLAGLSSLVVAACSPSLPAPSPGTTSVPQVSATSAVPSPNAAATVEPTTTNTLPPPPPPSGPAPATAGSLTATSLPIPAGWETAVRAGSDEEGFEGNGTWVHARDPRYAAQDVITLGCATVTRDDYTDQTYGGPRRQLSQSVRRPRDRTGPGIR